ncbi:MAG: hypothetical protein FJW36_21630 [Acidobacteria bacterium]|nr:hypothetical protein [Acidobacteriota bacterium]
MTSVEFAVPVVVAGVATESKTEGKFVGAEVGSEDLLDGLNPELAALTGVWAAIFQQQNLPPADQPAGKTLEQNGEVDAEAPDSVRAEWKPQPDLVAIKDPGKSPTQALAGLLASLGPTFQSVVAQAAKTESAPPPAITATPVTTTAPATAPTLTTPFAAPAAKHVDVENHSRTAAHESPLPELLPQNNLSSLRRTGDELNATEPILIPDTKAPTQLEIIEEPAASKLNQTADLQPAISQPLVALPLNREPVSAAPTRQASLRKGATTNPLVSTDLDSELDAQAVDPKLATEISLRKKLVDPVRFDLGQPSAASDNTNSIASIVAEPSVVAEVGMPQSEASFSPEPSQATPKESWSTDSSSLIPEDLGASNPLSRETGVELRPELPVEAPQAPTVATSPTPAPEVNSSAMSLRQPTTAKAAPAPAKPTAFEEAVPVPSPPPRSLPASQREARTISIRIPLTDSSRSAGGQPRHLDLIFSQKNNDLSLQFFSPNTEIQRNIEESMPSLMDKLRAQNWTATSADPSIATQAAEPMLEARRRVDSLGLSPSVRHESRHCRLPGGKSTGQPAFVLAESL